MRSRGLKLPRWLVSVNVVLLVFGIAVFVIFQAMSAQQPELDGAKRWQGEGENRYSQIACFLPFDQTKTEQDIIAFRRTLDEKLVQEAFSSSQGSLYADSYSAEGNLTVSTDHGKTSATAYGVGGDFFLFHPMDLHCGNLFSSRDLMQDRIVIDENLAWTLFGSKDVAGLTVYVENVPFVVSGVVKREQANAMDAAFPADEPLLILSYDAFYGLTEGGISCYEIVLVDPVSGYAMKIMEELFPLGEGELRENTGRFAAGNLLAVARDFGKRSMVLTPVVYPYWENALRMMEDQLSLLLVIALLCLLLPFVSIAVALIAVSVVAVKWMVKKIPAYLDRKVQSRREKRYTKRH